MMPNYQPPRFGDRLLNWFCSKEVIETLQGDLHELYSKRRRKNGKFNADIYFLLEVLDVCRPFALQRKSKSNYSNITVMFNNHFKIATRKILKHKGNTFTKIFSLSIGIISLFFILIYLNHETSFDDFHTKRSNIYKLNTAIKSPTGDLSLGLTAIPIGNYIKSIAPEVEEYVRITSEYGSHAVRYEEKLFSEAENIYYADQNFFKLFDFQLIAGNKESALSGPDKILISERTAHKYFGTTDALDHVLLYDGEPFTVTGIIKNIPANSHLQFDFLISIDTFLKSRPNANQNWSWFPMNTYLLLNPGSNIENLKDKLDEIPEYQPDNSPNERYVVSLEAMTGMHFSEPKLGELGAKGNISNIYLLFGIGIMILLLALSNFINLTTAQISIQGREVAVKKTIGASRRDVINQFLIESFLIIALSFAISAGVIVLLFDYFEIFMGTAFDLGYLLDPGILLLILILPILLSLTGGIYPAIKFSNFSPVHTINEGKTRRKVISTRASLLVFQFCITSALVICSLVIYYQMNYIKNLDLGMDIDQKLVIDFGPNGSIGSAFESLGEELRAIPGVESITFSSHIPGQMPNGTSTQIKDGSGKIRSGDINLNLVDYNFISKYGLKIIAGRDFRRGVADNTTALIVNEACVKAFGYTNPEDIIGASYEQWGGNGKVIGVVSDFNYLSLHDDIGLLSLKMWPEQFQKITIKVSENNIGETLNALELKWMTLNPNIPFHYYFVNENFRAQYQKDEQFSSIMNLFTIIAIFIGVLGLMSFATFWCERKRKEVSIRKVLGADSALLVWNLFRGFSLPVLIGFLIAIPFAYYFSIQWLNQFAYHINISWTIFVIPILLLFTFVWVAVGSQTFNLVRSNPINNLKDE